MRGPFSCLIACALLDRCPLGRLKPAPPLIALIAPVCCRSLGNTARDRAPGSHRSGRDEHVARSAVAVAMVWAGAFAPVVVRRACHSPAGRPRHAHSRYAATRPRRVRRASPRRMATAGVTWELPPSSQPGSAVAAYSPARASHASSFRHPSPALPCPAAPLLMRRHFGQSARPGW
jgi:hypothetical protein